MPLPKAYVTRRVQDAGLGLLPGRVEFEVWEKTVPWTGKCFWRRPHRFRGFCAPFRTG